MSIKLTDTQLVLLSVAAQREDLCLVASQNLKGGAAQNVAAKLLAGNLAKEIKAKADMPVWRRDEAGQAYALKLTAAGLKAIAVDGDAKKPIDDAAPRGAATSTARKSGVENIEPVAMSASAPRTGSKLMIVIGLMQRPEGATIEDLTVATAWLPHTMRAAITGLRKRAYAVSLERTDKVRGSVYRIAAPAGDRILVNASAVGSSEPAAVDQAPAGKASRGRRRRVEAEAAQAA